MKKLFPVIPTELPIIIEVFEIKINFITKVAIANFAITTIVTTIVITIFIILITTIVITIPIIFIFLDDLVQNYAIFMPEYNEFIVHTTR